MIQTMQITQALLTLEDADETSTSREDVDEEDLERKNMLYRNSQRLMAMRRAVAEDEEEEGRGGRS